MMMRTGRCHAVIHVNKYGRRARASEHVERIVPCRCFEQFWSPEDNSYICLGCWTPVKEEKKKTQAEV